jgi:hypothetical protein
LVLFAVHEQLAPDQLVQPVGHFQLRAAGGLLEEVELKVRREHGRAFDYLPGHRTQPAKPLLHCFQHRSGQRQLPGRTGQQVPFELGANCFQNKEGIAGRGACNPLRQRSGSGSGFPADEGQLQAGDDRPLGCYDADAARLALSLQSSFVSGARLRQWLDAEFPLQHHGASLILAQGGGAVAGGGIEPDEAAVDLFRQFIKGQVAVRGPDGCRIVAAHLQKVCCRQVVVELAQHPRQLAAGFGFRSIRPEEKGEALPRDGFSGVDQVVEQGARLPPGEAVWLTLPGQ